MVCYQLMHRLRKAGGWRELKEMTGEIRAPYVGLEGAEEVLDLFDRLIPKYSKLSKKSVDLTVTEIAWMQVRLLCYVLLSASWLTEFDRCMIR
jgi:hypothetical protein